MNLMFYLYATVSQQKWYIIVGVLIFLKHDNIKILNLENITICSGMKFVYMHSQIIIISHDGNY